MKIASLLIIGFLALTSAQTQSTEISGLNTALMDCISKLTLPFAVDKAATTQLYQEFMTNYQACKETDWNAQFLCIQTTIKTIPLYTSATNAIAQDSSSATKHQTYGNQIVQCMKSNINLSSIKLIFSFLVLAVFAFAF